MSTKFRPSNEMEFNDAKQAKMPGLVEHCIVCNEDFGADNTHSHEGWAETQKSGMCEDCFDTICADDEDDEIDDGASEEDDYE